MDILIQVGKHRILTATFALSGKTAFPRGPLPASGGGLKRAGSPKAK